MDLRPQFISGNSLGVKMVLLDPKRRRRILLNDSTRHGSQSIDPQNELEPLDYYHRTGPLGDVFRAFGGSGCPPRVAVVGLGVGAMAAYAEPGQQFTFYEIDPGVADIARNPAHFTFLSRCRGTCEITLGDALVTLPGAPAGHYGMIVLDAFSADVIPQHLLSPEALDVYLAKLADGGLVVFHVSNVHLDLEPVIGRLAAEAKLAGLSRADLQVSDQERSRGKLPSHYLALTGRLTPAGELLDNPKWKKLGPQ